MTEGELTMEWTGYIIGFLSAPVVVGIAALFGKIWAGRILEKDRARYQTEVESLLQDMRTKDNKELLVHRLQFEKEFAIYQELWVSARKLAIACQVFQDLFMDPGKSKDELYQELGHAHGAFSDVVRTNEPFYATKVYLVAEELHELVLSLYRLDKRLRRLDEAPMASEKMQDKRCDLMCDLDEKESEILDAISAILPKLSAAIRARVWSTKDTG
jgi:hypothetical protein